MAMTKKTYTLTSEEISLLANIKDKALSKKVVLNDSLIVRLGIHLVAQLPIDKLIKATSKITTK
jgi:hypothetical protein